MSYTTKLAVNGPRNRAIGRVDRSIIPERSGQVKVDPTQTGEPKALGRTGADGWAFRREMRCRNREAVDLDVMVAVLYPCQYCPTGALRQRNAHGSSRDCGPREPHILPPCGSRIRWRASAACTIPTPSAPRLPTHRQPDAHLRHAAVGPGEVGDEAHGDLLAP